MRLHYRTNCSRSVLGPGCKSAGPERERLQERQKQGKRRGQLGKLSLSLFYIVGNLDNVSQRNLRFKLELNCLKTCS